MNFPNMEGIYEHDYRSDILYQIPKLFDVWYFADPNQEICNSKVYGNLKIVTNRDYLAKVQFEDIFILGYDDSNNVYQTIEE